MPSEAFILTSSFFPPPNPGRAFFWLVSLLLSSLVWFVAAKASDPTDQALQRGLLVFGVLFSVTLQEAFRFLYYKLLRCGQGAGGTRKAVGEAGAASGPRPRIGQCQAGLVFGGRRRRPPPSLPAARFPARSRGCVLPVPPSSRPVDGQASRSLALQVGGPRHLPRDGLLPQFGLLKSSFHICELSSSFFTIVV